MSSPVLSPSSFLLLVDMPWQPKSFLFNWYQFNAAENGVGVEAFGWTLSTRVCPASWLQAAVQFQTCLPESEHGF